MTALRSATRRAVTALAVAASLGATALPRAAHAAGAAGAEQQDFPKSYVALMHMKPMDVMHKIDVDKKGYVTKEEFMKFHEKMFDMMDRDHDGKVTEQEWA